MARKCIHILVVALSSFHGSSVRKTGFATDTSMVDNDLGGDSEQKEKVSGASSDAQLGARHEIAGDGGPSDLANQIKVMAEIDEIYKSGYNAEYARKTASWCKGRDLHAKVWRSYMQELHTDFVDAPNWHTGHLWTKWILGMEPFRNNELGPVSYVDADPDKLGGFIRFSDYRKTVNLLNANNFKDTFSRSDLGGSYAVALWIQANCIDRDDYITIVKSLHQTWKFSTAAKKAMEDLQSGANKKCLVPASDLNCEYASWGCQVQGKRPDEQPESVPVKPTMMSDSMWNSMSENCHNALDQCKQYDYCMNNDEKCPGAEKCECHDKENDKPARSEATPCTTTGVLLLLAALAAVGQY